jgi:hypothetical protein
MDDGACCFGALLAEHFNTPLSSRRKGGWQEKRKKKEGRAEKLKVVVGAHSLVQYGTLSCEACAGLT